MSVQKYRQAYHRIFRRVRKNAKSDCYLRQVGMSVRMKQIGSHWTDFHEIWGILENLSWKFRFHQNLTRITDTLHEYQHIFMITSRWILRTRNVSDKNWRENQNIHNFIFSNSPPPPPRKIVRVWDHVEKYGTSTDDNTIRRMRIVCCITKATDTLRICNTYCFSTARKVTGTRLKVT